MTSVGRAVDYLLRLPRYDKRGASALKPGFERIIALLKAIGNPEGAYPSVLIAGTNGKGSTASLLSAIVTAHGLRVGLHTSPHIHHVTERMRIDGRPADVTWLERAVAHSRVYFERIQPSFFEATLALSLQYFAENGVDIAVVEVGLGGRLDATNVLKPVACAISRVGFDHMDYLGDTLEAIAGEKAGIIKPGVPVWTSNDDAAVVDTLRNAADVVGAPLTTTGTLFPWSATVPGIRDTVLDARSDKRRYAGLHVGLRGRHQAENALLAIAVAEHILGARLDPRRVSVGLHEVERLSGISGRLRVLAESPLIVSDAAHNPSGVQSALAWLADVAPSVGRISVALGLMGDKAVDEIATLLAPRLDRLYPIEIASSRAMPADELAGVFRRLGADAMPFTIAPAGSVDAAIDDFRTRDSDVLLILGSHQVLEQTPVRDLQ